MFVARRLGALIARVPLAQLLKFHERCFAVKMRLPISSFVVDVDSASSATSLLTPPSIKAKSLTPFVACTGSELERFYVKASSSAAFPWQQNSRPVFSASRKLAEVAFVGRSNVGKSSLINTILQAKNLAATSQTPGCTKHLHFFPLKIRGKTHSSNPVFLVDLPGVGYAKASENALDSWNLLIGEYIRLRSQPLPSLVQRLGVSSDQVKESMDSNGTVEMLAQMPPLRRVFFLIDSRRGILPVDDAFLEFLHDQRVPHQIVLTKIDRLRSTACLDASLQLCRKHVIRSPHCLPRLQLVSAKATGSPGVRELAATIGEALKPLET